MFIVTELVVSGTQCKRNWWHVLSVIRMVYANLTLSLNYLTLQGSDLKSQVLLCVFTKVCSHWGKANVKASSPWDGFIMLYILNSSSWDQRSIFAFEFALFSECEKPFTTTEIYEELCLHCPTPIPMPMLILIATPRRLQWMSKGWHPDQC